MNTQMEDLHHTSVNNLHTIHYKKSVHILQFGKILCRTTIILQEKCDILDYKQQLTRQ